MAKQKTMTPSAFRLVICKLVCITTNKDDKGRDKLDTQETYRKEYKIGKAELL